jgi:hypothetical protein
MSDYAWDSQFADLFNRCLARYRSGDADFSKYYAEADAAFLRSIGCKPREFFDFVEDHADGGDPSLSTAILIASARRDYLRTIQHGHLSTKEILNSELPAKPEEMDGIPWLPRIIVKARAKLRGELHPDIMFCCGGDRNFLRTHDIAPADFLRVVWAAGDDDAKILAYVKGQRA